MLKKILTVVLTTSLFVAIGVTSNSCAPTAPDSPATTLGAAPPNLTLTKTDSTGGSAIGLSCGCTFALTITGQRGDANVHFVFNEPLDTVITTHNLSATFFHSLPHAGPDTTLAWIGLYYRSDSTANNPGTPLYDTVRVTAIY
ncbi:MAG TPA: hypothetical protein VFH95_09250 [Candidatus Kapabacteria bacterium]|nr:hypothetical protein [Candidatus Kapabacteria bacterium]